MGPIRQSVAQEDWEVGFIETGDRGREVRCRYRDQARYN